MSIPKPDLVRSDAEIARIGREMTAKAISDHVPDVPEYSSTPQEAIERSRKLPPGEATRFTRVLALPLTIRGTTAECLMVVLTLTLDAYETPPRLHLSMSHPGPAQPSRVPDGLAHKIAKLILPQGVECTEGVFQGVRHWKQTWEGAFA
jgi:hypothetical protein